METELELKGLPTEKHCLSESGFGEGRQKPLGPEPFMLPSHRPPSRTQTFSSGNDERRPGRLNPKLNLK